MNVVALRTKAEKQGQRGVAAVRGVTTRSAAYAKAQVGDLSAQGQRLARGVDGQIKQYAGRRGAAWIGGAERLVGNNLWTALALAALALCGLLLLV